MAADPALRESLGPAGYLYGQAYSSSGAVLVQLESDLRGEVIDSAYKNATTVDLIEAVTFVPPRRPGA